MNWAWVALGVLLSASAFYYLAMIAAALRHALRRRAPVPAALPGVSLLKPLHGAEAGLGECLASHFGQSYPQIELLGAASADHDPAAGVWREVADSYPGVRSDCLVADGQPAANRKVGKLERLAEAASCDLLLVTDADVSLPRHHLASGAAELADRRVGLVTALYRAVPMSSWASRCEALWTTAELQGRFLMATLVGGLRFAFGASMLFRRDDLERIGGFAAIRDYLADDYQLGRRIHQLGKRIVLAREPVTTHLGSSSASAVWAHQVRWARTIRISQPAGYLGLAVAQGSLWSLLAVLLPMAPLSLRALGWMCLALRLAAGFGVGWGVLGSRVVLRYGVLLPVVDLLAFGVWVAGGFGSWVVWQGRRIRVNRDGRIVQE